MALRRPANPYEAARLPMSGLDAAAVYAVKDLDTGERREHAGQDLLNIGLPVAISKKPGSALLTYERR